MTVEIKIPELGESISEATIGKWLKNPGDKVEADEPIVALETDKVAIEVPAPSDGFIGEHLFKEGDTVEVGTIIGTIGNTEDQTQISKKLETKNKEPIKVEIQKVPSPSAQRIITENKVDINVINGTGRDGQILKHDVMKVVAEKQTQLSTKNKPLSIGNEEIVPMTKLRQTIANRLKEVQNTAAILTTFNEVDMTNVLKIREKYKDKFQKKYNIKLGFMGFFAKACIKALKEYPAVNSEVRGTDVVYKKYINIGIAVATEKGLCVPVVKNAEDLSIPEIEIEVLELGTNARNDALKIDDMQGGTFTITNGGIFGSMMSTPILNPPQSAILGMHKIEKRPVVINDKIEIRSMMYLALSYDHRVIDGSEAVSFLEYIRKCIDDPADHLIDLF
jgi:2-oxoglutarate dehydrogenase E2 component (dihydrolipoamide succinyltransferase)